MGKTKKRVRKLRCPQIDVDPYRGEWIAMDPKSYRVISHDKSLEQAASAAEQAGYDDPVFMRVPKTDAYFMGFHA